MLESTENGKKRNWLQSWLITKTLNWWITKIVSVFVLYYLITSLGFLSETNNDQESSLKTEHIILFSIVLLFNSDFIEKVESFSFGDLSAKFATKEEVNELEDELDILLVGTVLDSYEFITLEKIQGKRQDKFSINPSGIALLERLINRGLVEEKARDVVLGDKKEREIKLRDFFWITKKGDKYLQVVEKKGINIELGKIAERIGYTDSRVDSR
jgi:hypothetical protein